MLRNVSGQRWRVYAYDRTTGEPKTGDAANISARITKDFGTPAATDDAAPTEVDSTNEPGYYDFTILQTESNAHTVSLSPKSSTADITVIACPTVQNTIPQYFSLAGIESDGDFTKVNTLDGHTAQTGDNYARLGAPAGASVSADVAAVKSKADAIEVDTQDLQAQVGTDGAGLTAIPWNASWDAEVQSECTDALNAYDPPTRAEATADKDAILSRGNSAWITATGFSTHSAADVWAVATRTITAFSFDVALAASQPNYAPAKAGDEMDLVDAPNATAVTAIQDGLSTYDGSDTSGTTTILTRLSSARAGYLDKLNVSGTLAHSDAANTYKADVSALATSAEITALEGHGDSTWSTADVSGLSTFNPATDIVAHVTLVDTTTTNTDMRGTDNAYTGTPTEPPTVTAIRQEIDANSTQLAAIVEDTNELQANQGNWTTADLTGLSTYNPATNEFEDGVTYEDLAKAQGAVLAGRISNAGENTEEYQAMGNPGTTRLTVVSDASGNRSSVTLS